MGELCFHPPFHPLVRYLMPQNFPSIYSAIETLLLHFCAEPLCFASYYKRPSKPWRTPGLLPQPPVIWQANGEHLMSQALCLGET